MKRAEVIQGLLDLYERPSYLEIGVEQGHTFNAVTAARKVAVDIEFEFDWKSISSGAANNNSSYFEVESDKYFGELKGAETFDVIFIDGLHTYEQSLRDLLNACSCLNRGGVVVVDDVIPSTYSASLQSLERSHQFEVKSGHYDPDGSWMGDVFRVVFFVNTFMPAFTYATIKENHGQMVMWGAQRTAGIGLTIEDTLRLTYSDTILRREVYNILSYAEIVSEVSSWRKNVSYTRSV